MTHIDYVSIKNSNILWDPHIILIAIDFGMIAIQTSHSLPKFGHALVLVMTKFWSGHLRSSSKQPPCAHAKGDREFRFHLHAQW
uniref:Uncharacterized protein n=1 Tax=Arundo donax TaxID=35708 RepID=A0A0A9PRJ2_ARUDO